MNVQWVDIDNVIPYEKNPRNNDEAVVLPFTTIVASKLNEKESLETA